MENNPSDMQTQTDETEPIWGICDSHGITDCDICMTIEMTTPIPDNEICKCEDCKPITPRKIIRKEWYDERLHAWIGSTDDGNENIIEML